MSLAAVAVCSVFLPAAGEGGSLTAQAELAELCHRPSDSSCLQAAAQDLQAARAPAQQWHSERGLAWADALSKNDPQESYTFRGCKKH